MSEPQQVYKPPAQYAKHPPTNYVPVVSCTGKPLMPCHPQRARELMDKGKAKPRWWFGSLFYIQLTERADGVVDPNVTLGIDPGSKFEGYSVRSTTRTLLNVQSAAPTHVKKRVADRRMLRRNRRQRNTPCRKNKMHRSSSTTSGRILPSTRARCDAKINLVKKLMQLYPIKKIIIEDIQARTKNSKSKGSAAWNTNFVPIQVGKNYMYAKLRELVPTLILVEGFTTHTIRSLLRTVVKAKLKSAKIFEAHCLDAWVLAGMGLGHEALEEPDNMSMWCLEPILLHRRQLHVSNPIKEGVRKNQGGTRSMGLKRGSLAHHPKYGCTYVGGSSSNRITLHDIKTGKRLSRDIHPADCKFLKFNTMKAKFIQRVEMTCKICGIVKAIAQKVLKGKLTAELASVSPACSPGCYTTWIHKLGEIGRGGNPLQRKVAYA